MTYYVQLISHETGEVVKEIGPTSGERKADKVASGLERQASDDYYATVDERED